MEVSAFLSAVKQYFVHACLQQSSNSEMSDITEQYIKFCMKPGNKATEPMNFLNLHLEKRLSAVL
jgi:hypothetical protein